MIKEFVETIEVLTKINVQNLSEYSLDHDANEDSRFGKSEAREPEAPTESSDRLAEASLVISRAD